MQIQNSPYLKSDLRLMHTSCRMDRNKIRGTLSFPLNHRNGALIRQLTFEPASLSCQANVIQPLCWTLSVLIFKSSCI